MNANVTYPTDSELIDKHFGFLVDFGFERIAVNKFESKKIRLVVEFDPMKSVEPEITMWFKSEPKYTIIDFHWLIKDEIDYDRLWKSKSYESNVAYYAGLLHSHISQLVNYSDSLLLKGLKRLFVNIIKSNRLTKQNYISNMPPDAMKYYYHIKKKEPKWDPGKEL